MRVVDDGPGVPAALRPRLFEPLRTTKPDGLGLGLPIARALARAMDGDLALEDADGAGVSFRLVLPSAEAA